MGIIYNYIAQAKYLSSRNWLMAVQVLEKAIEDHPEEGALFAELAELYFNKEEYNKAAQYYTQAIKYDQNNDHYHFKLGNCYISLKNANKALKAYNSVKNYLPEVLFNKSIAYNYLGKYDEAMKCLDKLVDAKAEFEALYIMILENLVMARNFNSMEKYIEPARKAIGDKGVFHFFMGQYYFGKENFVASYSEFILAREKNYYSDYFVHFYALASFEIGKTDQAFEILEKGIADYPDFDFFLYDRIRLNLRLKKKRPANADFKVLKQKNPTLAREAEMLFFASKILK